MRVEEFICRVDRGYATTQDTYTSLAECLREAKKHKRSSVARALTFVDPSIPSPLRNRWTYRYKILWRMND